MPDDIPTGELSICNACGLPLVDPECEINARPRACACTAIGWCEECDQSCDHCQCGEQELLAEIAEYRQHARWDLTQRDLFVSSIR